MTSRARSRVVEPPSTAGRSLVLAYFRSSRSNVASRFIILKNRMTPQLSYSSNNQIGETSISIGNSIQSNSGGSAMTSSDFHPSTRTTQQTQTQQTEDAITSTNTSTSTTSTTKTAASSSFLGIEEKFSRALKLEEEAEHGVPKEELTAEELDALYAKDMFELSMNERDKVLQDVHGVADVIEETPEFIKERQAQLLHELNKLVAKQKHKHKQTTAAYEQALQQNANFVQSEKFQLPFLRADRWDPTRAANRVISFLEAKLKLFGPKLLCQTICISDLNREDRKSLESGFFQLLPVRDVAGRGLVCGMPMLKQYKKLENLVSPVCDSFCTVVGI
jgi:hypothetical protein